VNTALDTVYERMAAGHVCEGVFVLRKGFKFVDFIEELYMIAAVTNKEEWSNKIAFIPLH
jgi:hypothetical protein